MSKRRKRPAEEGSGRRLVFPVLLWAVLYFLSSVAIVMNTAPDETEYSVGEISPKTVTATRDVVDKYSTELLREEEMQKVLPVYTTDEAVQRESISRTESDFALLEQARSNARQLYASKYEPTHSVSAVPSGIDWAAALSAADKQSLLGAMPEYATEAELITAVSMTQDKLVLLRDATLARVRTQYSGGVLADDLDETALSIKTGLISGGTFTTSEADLACVVVRNDMRANKTFDSDATELARQEAASRVGEVVYKKGQNIVQRGEIVTEGQLAVLAELGLTSNHISLWPRYISSFLLMLLLYGCALIYMIVLEKQAMLKTKSYLAVSLLTLLCIGLCIASRTLDQRIFPAFLPIILGAAVLKRRSALAFGIFLTILGAAILSPSVGFVFSEQVMQLMLAGIFGGTLGIMVLQKQFHRGEYVLAGFCAGLVNAAVYLAYNICGDYTLTSVLTVIGIGTANGLAAGLLSVGILPIMEAMFSLATPSKLLELSNPATPLLKRLMVETPGTYQHSVMASNLAEAGCEAIGADELLARVATYYHDIGKLENPMMFKENQFGADNPHDSLTPRESADILFSHVIFGRELAESYKLPRQIRDIISEHHGDTLAAYFYHRAKQQGLEPREDSYRYPGPKPHSREAGVVMLADSVEAAVRANGCYAGAELRKCVEKTIEGKHDEGQFEECQITKRDLRRIGDAFITVFECASHERIKYPEDEKDDIRRIGGA